MIKNDRVYGAPLCQYKDTKTNITALSGVEEGAIAYATDTNEFGSFDGSTWTWGQSGSTAPATTAANDFQAGDGSGNWVKKTLAETITILRTSLDGIFAALSHTHAASDVVSGTIDTERLPTQFATNTNDVFALTSVGSSGWTGTINGTPSGVTVTYTNVSGNKNTLVPASTSQLGKQRLYNTTRGTYALISTSNGTSTITLTSSVPVGWANGDTITTISPTVASGQNHIDVEITSGELLNKSNVWLWAVIVDSGAGVLMRFHPFETFSTSKQFNIFNPAANVAFGGLQAYKLVSNVLTIAWTASGSATASPTVRQVGYIK